MWYVTIFLEGSILLERNFFKLFVLWNQVEFFVKGDTKKYLNLSVYCERSFVLYKNAK